MSQIVFPEVAIAVIEPVKAASTPDVILMIAPLIILGVFLWSIMTKVMRLRF